MSRFATLAALALLTVGAGCAPQTTIRRSAFVPAGAAPASIGRPLQGGELRVSGEAATHDGDAADHGEGWVSEEGDPGLLRPTRTVGGNAMVGLGDRVELGGRVQYAAYDWTMATTAGVMDLPAEHQDALWMYGPAVRVHVPLESVAHLSFGAEWNFAEIPQAVYRCEACAGGDYWADETVGYAFERMDNETFLLPNVSAQLGADVTQWGHLSLFGALERGVTNIGFDSDPSRDQEDTLEGYWFGVAGAGGEIHAGALVAGATAYVTMGDELNQGFSLSGHLGVKLGGGS